MELKDKHHRIANYLRIGVTDRCNLRCRYCMPEEGIDFADRHDLLTYEEIIRLAKVFRTLGVEKVRLTGGEPFVRKDIEFLLRSLRTIFPKLHITTNATLLQHHIDLLKDLHVDGINISIDSLDRDKFTMITRRNAFDTVMDNILACRKAGLPTKLNMVVMQGVNDMELIDFVQFGIDHQIEVRFIEAMPFNADDGNKQVFMSAHDIMDQIKKVYPHLHPIENHGASSLTYSLGQGNKIGVIPAYSRSLCGFCNRIRMTPQGELMTCLYSTQGTDLRKAVRTSSITDEALADVIMGAVLEKKKDGFEEEKLQNGDVFRSMTTIGG